MNHENLTAPELKSHHHSISSPQNFEGIYHSTSVNKSPEEVYAFCQNESNLRRVLVDLPEKTKNFLDLEFVGASQTDNEAFQVNWRNKSNSEIQGTLTFIVSPSSHKGAILIGNAVFADYTMNKEAPCDFINLFLRRLKGLAETGEIATIEGQPNGKDEKEIDKSIKH